MNTSFKIMLGASFLVLMSCSKSSQTETNPNTDSTVVTEETAIATVAEETVNADFGQMESTARQVFALVFPPGEKADDFEGIVISKCTPSFVDALKRANDFDDGSLAWWALRTMEQEGPEEESSVISITSDGDDAVLVEYSDMGHKATTRLEFVKDGDDCKVNAATISFNGERRTVK
ncbi:MAG: hypothetical protein HDS00_03670 [Bacteroides sp.]|nr:hypothetical protein [Bacteroides sp.]